MDTEMKDKDVNVEKIMEEIRERVKKKKAMGIYSEEDVKKVSEMELPPYGIHIQGRERVQHHLAQLRLKWDPRCDEPITSHRQRIGPLIVLFKRGLRKLFKPVINVTLLRQAEFNTQLVRLLENFVSNFMLLAHDSEVSFTKSGDKIERLKHGQEELTKRGVNLRQEIILQKLRLERILTQLEGSGNTPAEAVTSLTKEKARLMDHDYFLFEDRFRGDRNEIRQRQAKYLPAFKGAEDVLDIGCGRGEFLELLKMEGIKARGIDLNEDMIHICKEKGLDVKQADVISYLKSLADESLGGILASHIIEHFPMDLLVEFVKLCSAKLKKRGRLALETPNPLSIIVSAVNFHLDLSHVKPIHPEALKFLLESTGFVNVKINYLSPYPEEMKFKLIPHDDEKTSSNLAVEVMNKNIEKLNKILYGYQDFSVIADK